MDRDARKAFISARGENVGHPATGILYHLHGCKSLHHAPVRDDEKLRTAGKQDKTDVLRIHEGMVIHRADDKGLQRRP